MSVPAVSIVTCSYNHIAYIAACANSVLAQTNPNWEWLIADDGSTDGTAEFMAELKDPRIRFFKKQHKGIDSVLERKNELLTLCRGEWIAFMDSDDVWMPDRLEKQLRAVENSDVVLVHGDIWLINSAGEKKRRLHPGADRKVLLNDPVGAAAVEALAALNFPAFSTSSLVRRSTLLEVGGFKSGNALWDFSTFLEVSLRGRFRYVAEPLACWRRHGAQTSIMLDRLSRQYDAHLERSQEFLAAHLSALHAAGLQEETLDKRQKKIIQKTKNAGKLMRADSFLDIGAWADARALYAQHLKSGGPEGRLAAVVGYASTRLHCNVLRVASTIKNKFQKITALGPTQYFVFLVALTAVWRACMEPGWLFGGQMYNEMAVNYFKNTQLHRGLLPLLFAPDAGYIPLLQRLLALLGMGMSAKWIPYFYTWSALLLAPMIAGVFILKPCRALIPSDSARFLLTLIALLGMDFETRLFLNFTYVALFAMTALCALALQEPHDFPRWCWPLLLLSCSKPYILALTPVMIYIAVRARTIRVRFFFGFFILLMAVQLVCLIKNSPRGLVEAGDSIAVTHLQILEAAFLYFFTTIGHNLIGPLLPLHRSDAIIFWCLGVFGAAILLIVIGAAFFSRGKRQWLLWVALALILGVTLINCASITNHWNIHLKATSVGLNRRTIGVFFGCVFIVGWMADKIGEMRWPVKLEWMPVNARATTLILLWFFCTGWFLKAIKLSQPRTFPDLGVSDWQRMAPLIDGGVTPLCVLIDPYRCVYGLHLAPVQNFPNPDPHLFLLFSARAEIEVPVSTFTSIGAIGVVVAPLLGHVGERVEIHFVLDTSEGRKVFSNNRVVTSPTVILANFSNTVSGIQKAWISCDRPINILTTGEAPSRPAMIYVRTDSLL